MMWRVLKAGYLLLQVVGSWLLCVLVRIWYQQVILKTK
jgi:hypothetical protein